MSLSSMTGYGHADGSHGALHWRWELRSVNGRGLDIRLRLPTGFEALDQPVRERLRAAVQRGSVTVGLQVRHDTEDATIRVNAAALDAALAALDTVATRLGQAAPDRTALDPLRLVTLRGILDQGETETAIDEGGRDALVAGFETALAALTSARKEEGARLVAVLDGQIDAIETHAAAARRAPERAPEAIRARLQSQIDRLHEADNKKTLDPDRLHQEAVLLAAKADIQEELDRLDAHVAQARGLISAGGTVGRRLDFLAQEFNREANTLCSKANDVAITRIGLDLKAVIDQVREQVQNIE